MKGIRTTYENGMVLICKGKKKKEDTCACSHRWTRSVVSLRFTSCFIRPRPPRLTFLAGLLSCSPLILSVTRWKIARLLSVCLCVSSAAVLQRPEEENLQRGGLRQVVQQAVLPGGHWDLHGERLTLIRPRYYWWEGLDARSKQIVLAASRLAERKLFRNRIQFIWNYFNTLRKQPLVLCIYVYQLAYILKPFWFKSQCNFF